MCELGFKVVVVSLSNYFLSLTSFKTKLTQYLQCNVPPIAKKTLGHRVLAMGGTYAITSIYNT